MKNKDNLTKWTALALILGLTVGAMVHAFHWQETGFYVELSRVLELGSYIFIGLLKLLVAPVVFVSLVYGVGSSENVMKLGKIGLKTMLAYISCTTMALTLALSLAANIEFGHGVDQATAAEFKAQSVNWLDAVKAMVPTNLIGAFAEMDMMQVIFISLIIGVALAKTQPQTHKVLELFEQLNTLVNEWVILTIKFAPIGIFCLMTDVFAKKGIGFLGPMAGYFFIVLLALVLHITLIYGSILKWAIGVGFIDFLKKFKSVMLFAFSTSSSQATLSLNMAVTEKQLGVSRSISSFTLPLGATVNMDGTAIMQGVATIFIAQVYGVELSFVQLVLVVVMATLASIGTAGVPSVGLITLSMVLSQVGLPVEGIGLILGVDRLLDMSRTVVNVMGDTVVTLWVAKTEEAWDRRVYETST